MLGLGGRWGSLVHPKASFNELKQHMTIYQYSNTLKQTGAELLLGTISGADRAVKGDYKKGRTESKMPIQYGTPGFSFVVFE